MKTTGVNFLAILVSAAAYFVIGALWYSKGLFNKAWVEGIGKTPEQVNADFSPWKLVWCFVASFFAAYGIARILSWLTEVTIYAGFVVGLLTGICFVCAAMSINDVMESRPRKLTFVNLAYHVVGFVVMGIILGLWK